MNCKNTRPALIKDYLEYLNSNILLNESKLKDWHIEFARMCKQYDESSWWRKRFYADPRYGYLDSGFCMFHEFRLQYSRAINICKEEARVATYQRDKIGTDYIDVPIDSDFWEGGV